MESEFHFKNDKKIYWKVKKKKNKNIFKTFTTNNSSQNFYIAYHIIEIIPTIIPSMTTFSKAMNLLWTFFQEKHELRQILLAESFTDLIAALLEMIHLPETIQQVDPTSITRLVEINLEISKKISKEANERLNELISSLPIDLVFGAVSKLIAISASQPQIVPPAWYRRHCGEILSGLLIQPSGVLFTMERMLSISPERSVDILQRFASLLEKIPQSIQKDVRKEIFHLFLFFTLFFSLFLFLRFIGNLFVDNFEQFS